MSHSQFAGQELSVEDLSVVMEELNDTRVKWYNIGLQLRMSIGTLDAIKEQYDDFSHCLRETLKAWLKTCPSAPTWNNIVAALKSSTVGEVRLAADLEQKYCSTQDASIAATHHQAPTAPHHTQMTLPPQTTIPPTQLPMFTYAVTPPSQPPTWSVPYYYLPHTSYPLSTPFPVTPPSGVATASVHPTYSQVPQVTPTSSRPLLPSVPAQPTTPQFQITSPSSFNITPQDTSPIPASATVTTPTDLPPVTTHTLGMEVSCTTLQHSVLSSI